MSDLISRQAAIDFIDAGRLCNPNEPRWSDNEIVNFLKSRPSAHPERCEDCRNFNKARLLIPQPERKNEKLPTIEIVRCGECKYHPNNPRWYADNDPIETFIHCQFMKADDYCSKGKEQEDKE